MEFLAPITDMNTLRMLRLDVTCNKLGGGGAVALAKLLRAEHLASCDVKLCGNTRLTATGIQDLVTRVLDAPKLRSLGLGLRRVRVGLDGAQTLSRLGESKALETLKLETNSVCLQTCKLCARCS